MYTKKFIKIIILIVLIFSISGCNKYVNQNQITYVNTIVLKELKNFNDLTPNTLQQEVYGIGPKKSTIIFNEKEANGEFISALDFENRLKYKLADRMIYKIVEQYKF